MCIKVLDLMKEVKEEVEGEVGEEGDEVQNSDVSPYHSDSDSAVMMSGNSPFISKVKKCTLKKSVKRILRTL